MLRVSIPQLALALVGMLALQETWAVAVAEAEATALAPHSDHRSILYTRVSYDSLARLHQLLEIKAASSRVERPKERKQEVIGPFAVLFPGFPRFQ